MLERKVLPNMSYTWEGITKINYEQAIELFNANKEVYLLYDDDTEGLAHELADIKRHIVNSGEFGYEC